MIIGLGHKSGVGKDTVADWLVQKHEFQKIAFARPLKLAACAIFGWTAQHTDGDLKEVVDPFWGVTPRRVLQLLGTECLRKHFRDDLWVKAAERAMFSDPYHHARWVVTDVRFQNEADAVKRWGGFLVCVDRARPEVEDATRVHVSETALDGFTGWDRRIGNHGTLVSLCQKVDELVNIVAAQVGVPPRPQAPEKVAELECEELREKVQILEAELFRLRQTR